MSEPLERTFTPRAAGRERSYAFRVASAALVVVFAASASPIPLFNLYRAEDGLTNADMALTVVAYFAGTILALLTLGRVANHIGRRSAALAVLLLLMAGALVLLHVPNVFPLLLGRFLMGVGCGLASSALMAYVVDAAPTRPAWLASVVTSQAPLFGLTLGALLSGALVEYGPVPRITVYLAMLAALAVCTILLTRAPETGSKSPGVWASMKPQVGFPQHARALLPAAAAVSVSTWALGGFFQAFGPSVVAEQLHTRNAVVVGLVFSSYMAPGIVGATFGSRFAPATAQRIGMTIFTVGGAGILLALFAGRVVPFIAAAVVASIGQGTAMSASLRAILHGMQPVQRAPTMAAIYLISYAGAMVPSLIAGQLSHVLPVPQIALGYGALALLGATVVWALAQNPNDRVT